MQFSLSVKYGDGEKKFSGLDQYYGAASLLGVSQVLLISLNAFFNREIITQAPSAKGFRIVLGKSKVGSWEQLLTLVITDPEVLKIAEDLGKNALYDLLKWALLGGVGTPFVLRYRKAQKIARELERQNDDLQEKLDEAIRRVHQPVKHQGLSVHVMAGRTNLATFDAKTLRYIETEVVENKNRLVDVVVSRFNARTGTSRFISKMDAVSVPFAPEGRLSKIHSTRLADNLALLTRGTFQPIQATVTRVTSKDGHLKRYLLHGVP